MIGQGVIFRRDPTFAVGPFGHSVGSNQPSSTHAPDLSGVVPKPMKPTVSPSSAADPTAPGSSEAVPLAERARAAMANELAAIHWLALLDPPEQQRVRQDLQVAVAEAGERICRIGKPATLWFGVIDGLLKMSNDSASGTPLTFTGVPSGAWFGEGTLLKRETYRYNIEALRTSVVAGVPIATFEWLLQRSLPFNRFVMNQLNERLGQFIAAREIDRSSDPDLRVARSLAALFHPLLYPGVGQLLRITQEELGYLVGLSRQRTNEALRTLQASGSIRVEYGGVRVLDLAQLRRYPMPEPPAVG
jgi:CRP/FNR family transcriptional regulator, cyclic AMP receptor protein